MTSLTRAFQFVRTTILSVRNRRILRNELSRLLGEQTIPLFFIFTPDIVHFAPYCIPTNAEGFEPVLILNSISPKDEQWLRQVYPQHLIISLKTSLSDNPESILSHGDVLNDLFACVKKPFCIQDPDCFVTNSSFWKQANLDIKHDVAGGPFFKKPTHHDHVLPNTFFLIFNPEIIKAVTSRYRISAGVRKKLPRKAQRKAQKLGYGIGQYPDAYKGYFDTLQAFWVLALAEGLNFKEMRGAGETIFHIGGTSYLHNSDYDLAHWDYWPLSVIYFNLKLLELPAGERFLGRFSSIRNQYGSSENLLAMYPEFGETWRFREMQTILDHIAG